MKKLAILGLSLVTFTLSHAAAATKGKIILEENFSGSELSKPWAPAKGEWKVADGALTGKELAKDDHGAVLKFPAKFNSVIVSFEFKLDGAKAISWVANGKGHILRISISKAQIAVRREKDKKNPADKAKTLAAAKKKYDDGKWHAVEVTSEGDKVTLKVDGRLIGQGRDERVNVDKSNFCLTVGGESGSFKNLKVWEVK